MWSSAATLSCRVHHWVCCLVAPAGLASAVVFLVHPSSEPSPNKLNLLVPALAAGCHCLVAINGPSRVDGLTARPAANVSGETQDKEHSGQALLC